MAKNKADRRKQMIRICALAVAVAASHSTLNNDLFTFIFL